MHLSDSHLSFTDERDSEQLVSHGQDRWKLFEEQGGMSPDLSFAGLIDYAGAEALDCTVMTGDIIDFPSLKNLEVLSEALDQNGIPYLYTVGNHDYACYLYEEETTKTKQLHQPDFDRLLKNDITFACTEINGVYLVAMDNSLYQFSEEQEQQLMKIAEEGKPMLLFFHIPIYTETLHEAVIPVWRQPIMCGCPESCLNHENPFWDRLIPTDTTLRVCRWIRENDRQIAGVFAGHVHFEHQDSLTSNLDQYIVAGGYYGKAAEIVCVPR